MAMTWDDNKQLNFGVSRKPKQVLKYVDTSSTHRSTVFKSITSGVLTCITQLTSKSTALQNLKFDQVYPEHVEALHDAGVALREFPTIGKLQDLEDEKCQQHEEENSNKQKDQQTTYL
eukprot:8360523-Ditylum_brightwellii.AAC.1